MRFEIILGFFLMNKFVIAKGYYGLGGSLAIVLCAMRLAKQSKRELIVDWIDGFYSISPDDIFKALFECPHSIVSRNDINGLKIFPQAWEEFILKTKPHPADLNLSRMSVDFIENNCDAPDDYDVLVVTRDDKYWHNSKFAGEFRALAKELIVAEPYKSEIKEYKNKYIIGNTIGVHFRHGNGEKTVIPPDIDWFFNAIDDFKENNREARIFLCTDCLAVMDEFKKKYGNRIISTEKIYPEIGTGAMHYEQSNDQRLRSAVEALKDIWLLGECSYFVGSKSFFSTLASRVGHGFSRENSRWWTPEIRSHKPLSSQKPLTAIAELANEFTKHEIPLDGLYVDLYDNQYQIFYLAFKIASIDMFSKINWIQMHSAIKKRRLY